MPAIGADVRETDDTFFKVFDFRFVDGKPYDEAIFNAGTPVAVITESISRALFGSTESAGKEFLLNHAPYRVVGVVKDVSTLADSSYGQVWIPFTSTDLPDDTWSDQHMGMMSVTILARSHDDFGEIRAEAKRRMSEYNSILADQGYMLIDRNRPYDQETQSISFAANLEPDLKSGRRERAIIFIISKSVAPTCGGNRSTSRFWKYPYGNGRTNYHGKLGSDFVGWCHWFVHQYCCSLFGY